MIGYRLKPEQLACVEDAARHIPERERGEFLKCVADRLRPVRDLRVSDIRHACAVALTRYGKPIQTARWK